MSPNNWFLFRLFLVLCFFVLGNEGQQTYPGNNGRGRPIGTEGPVRHPGTEGPVRNNPGNKDQDPNFVPDKGQFISKGLRNPDCAIYLASETAIYFENCFEVNADVSISINDHPIHELKEVKGGVLAEWDEKEKIQIKQQAKLLIKEKGQKDEPITFTQYNEVPKEKVIPGFSTLAHNLSSGNIVILNAKTFYVPKLYYDGTGPDAYFWVGNGNEGPDNTGKKIPNEEGSFDVLKGYQGKNIILTLPEDLTVYNIDYLGVWCVTFKHNFGYVNIPKDNLKVPPPFYMKKNPGLGFENESTFGARTFSSTIKIGLGVPQLYFYIAATLLGSIGIIFF